MEEQKVKNNISGSNAFLIVFTNDGKRTPSHGK